MCSRCWRTSISLSDIRTASAGAGAARILARQRSHGARRRNRVQERWQALLWGRHQARAEALTERLVRELPGVSIEAVPTCSLRYLKPTSLSLLARQQIIRGDWLRPGPHITTFGADDHTKCELDAHALQRARVFVDRRASAIANGDIGRAMVSGLYMSDDIAGELGELIAGSLVGRRDERDVTIAKLVGLGIQNLAAAEVALQKLGLIEGARFTQSD